MISIRTRWAGFWLATGYTDMRKGFPGLSLIVQKVLIDRSEASPSSALYYASRDRRQEHPERHLKTFTGILQAYAYGGYNPLRQAFCWAQSRRKFFVLADITANAERGKNAAPAD